jgi:hypothetical protein
MKLVAIATFALSALLVARAAQGTPESDARARIYAASDCAARHATGVGPSLLGLYGRAESTDQGQVFADGAYLRES